MKKVIALIIAVLIFCPVLFAAQDANQLNWAQTAVKDLDYMYQMYRDNHAGGIDPENPGFNKELEKEYKKARKKALKAKTELDYQKALVSFLAPFKDGHMRVQFNNKSFARFFFKKSLLKNLKELRKPLSYEEFGGDNVWIFLNTFGGPSKIFADFAPEIEKLKDKNIIVLDLRYNGGGNSYSGYRILYSLYGKDYISYIKQKVEENQRWYYRVTQWSLDSLKKAHKFYGGDEKTEKSMEDALSKGEDIYWPDAESNEKSSPALAADNLHAKIYVLTDNFCFSACLMFMDVIRGTGDIVQIGRETGGDTKYMQMWNEDLPSGLGNFSISYTGILNRPRKDNEVYKPDYKYKDDMDDTKAIQSWVIELDKKLKKKS